jgi:hypothetical protein
MRLRSTASQRGLGQEVPEETRAMEFLCNNRAIQNSHRVPSQVLCQVLINGYRKLAVLELDLSGNGQFPFIAESTCRFEKLFFGLNLGFEFLGNLLRPFGNLSFGLIGFGLEI